MIADMTLAQRFFAVTMATLLLIIVVDMVRRRQLREEYSWLWILAGAAILLLAAWPRALATVTVLIGAGTHTTAVFTFGILFLIVVCIHLCSKLSRIDHQLKELSQALAIRGAEQVDATSRDNG